MTKPRELMDNHEKVFIPTAKGLAENTVENVRQGHQGDHVRYILTWSLGIAVTLIMVLLALVS